MCIKQTISALSDLIRFGRQLSVMIIRWELGEYSKSWIRPFRFQFLGSTPPLIFDYSEYIVRELRNSWNPSRMALLCVYRSYRSQYWPVGEVLGFGF
jgi:hypothetical protein